MSAVQVVKLRKEFARRRRARRVVALDDVSLAVGRGECVAVLGQNGSGKSTLVRVLSTLLLADGGSAYVFGHDVRRDERAVRRLVNRVSVEASFFKRMSAVENLSYAARFYGLGPRLTRRRIPEILERVSFPAERADAPMEDLSFAGIGMVTAVLPLMSPEKGAQLGFIAQGLLLVVSGVYYPVEVMPGWMEALAAVSPATYALEGIRAAVLDGAGLGELGGDLWPLVGLGVIAIPAGLAVFRAGERYAKRHGKLKRSG